MKCPRCNRDMVCYVSSPVVGHEKARRLYFSCQCGMVAARNEEEHVTAPDQTDDELAGEEPNQHFPLQLARHPPQHDQRTDCNHGQHSIGLDQHERGINFTDGSGGGGRIEVHTSFEASPDLCRRMNPIAPPRLMSLAEAAARG